MEANMHATYMFNIQRDLNYLLNKKLKDLSLGKHDVMVLRVINANNGINQNAIAIILNEDKTTISKAVKRLSDRGYIEKRKTLEDKRITLVFITDKGLEIREVIIKIFKDVNKSLIKDLDEKECLIFDKLLKKVNNSLQDESKRLDDNEEKKQSQEM